jgi:predicted phosphodiesterase
LAVIGDAVAFDAARSGGFDFVLHAGDLVETPNAAYWEPWFDAFETMFLAAPFVPVLGNHEKNSVSYYKAFAHPPGAGQGDERWWALHWGDVVVVGLDTSVTRADRILEQQAYARAELSGDERWKFVIFHHPIYSSDAYHGSGYGYELIYHPIFVEAGVDIVFNGHAHNYERIENDGIVYLVLGGGGAAPRGLAPTRVSGSVVAIENHNFYARVTAAQGGISVEIVSVAEATDTLFAPTSGELLDSFVLVASARPTAAPAGTAATPSESEVALGESPREQVSQEQAPQGLVPQEPATEEQVLTAPSVAEVLALLVLLAIAAWALLRAGR